MPVSDAGLGRRFLLVLAVYFAAQAGLRIALGRSLILDEAEMMLLARDWRWGYGPQLPLYNWIQVAAFDLLGVGIAGLTIPKNLMLWLGYARLFAGLRQVVPIRQAVAGTLSLVLLPNVLWEFQRSSTHSIALLAAITWTIAATLAVLAKGRWRDYAALGVVIGIGCLAKANYPLTAVSLLLAGLVLSHAVPVPLRPARLAFATGLAALIVARPLIWVLQNPQAALASTAKLYVPQSSGLALAETLVGLMAGLILVVVAVAVMRRGWRERLPAGPAWPGQVVLLSGAIAAAIWVAGLIVADVSTVEARWMVPIMVPIAAGTMALAARRASPWALRVLSLSSVALGGVTLIGMAEMRLVGKNAGAIEFAALAALTDRLQPVAVLADVHVGGNLAMLRPDLPVLPPEPVGDPVPDGPVLLLEGDPISAAEAAAAFAERDMTSEAYKARRVGRLVLRYSFAPDARIDLHYQLLGP